MNDDEKLSAFLDGEWVPDDAFLERLDGDEPLRARWTEWHRVSEILVGHAGTGFDHARFRERLAAEPTVLVARPPRSRTAPMRARPLGWGLSLAAGIAAVVMVGSLVLPPSGNKDVPALAQSSSGPGTPVPVRTLPPGATGLDDYLLAHQPLSGSVLLGATPPVQTVSTPMSTGGQR